MQMPNEATKFEEVNVSWTKLMKNIFNNLYIIQFTKNRTFIDDLNLCYNNIEIV